MIGKNIIELQNELSYMPMEKLVSLVDDPNSMYGSLTLIEIQNRKALTDGAKSSQPIPTLAEDIVSSVAPSASLESTSPLSNQGSGGIAGIPRDELMGRLPSGGLQDILDSRNEQVQQYAGGEKVELLKDKVNLMGEASVSPLDQLRETYGYQNQEEFDKEKRMLMLMQLGSNVAGAEDFSDIIEGNQDMFTTRMALDKQRREDDMGLAALRLKGLSDPRDIESLTGSLAKAETLGYDQPNSEYHNLYLEILRKLEKELSVTQSTGIDTIKADVSPVAPSGV